MLIRDLPTKWVLVRRRDGESHYQRYHYRPELIPDKAFSQEVGHLVGRYEPALRHGQMPVVVDGEPMTLDELRRLDIPPRVVIPSAVRDWNRAKAKAIEKVSLWAFPMRIHLTDEYLRRIVQGESEEVDTAWRNLAALYTYSFPAEALQFLKRLGNEALRARKPMIDSRAWDWLSLTYERLQYVLSHRNEAFYLNAYPAIEEYSKFSFSYRNYLKLDYRLVWHYARIWFPLLVDVNARQVAWQVAEAHRRNIAPSDWVAGGFSLPEDSYEWKLVRYPFRSILSVPPVDARIRHYLSGDALQYYERVYDTMSKACRYYFRYGNLHYQQFADALES